MFQFMDSLFHLLARLEHDYVFFWHEHLVARAGIACLASSTTLHLEHAEVTQLDPMLRYQRLDDGVERLLHDFLRLQLGQPDFFRKWSGQSLSWSRLNSPLKRSPQAG